MEKIRIGDACDILNGYAFKSDKYVDDGIRVIRIANVQKGYIEDNAPAFYPIDSDGLDKYILEEGDLLMSLTGNVGRVALLQKEMLPAALNQRVACLRLKTDKITKGFLFHILNSDFFEQQCIQSSNGVAQKNMSTEWLKDYEIPLYSIEEQLMITEVLDGARKILSLRNDELSKLDDLIKARFVELFGDPKLNDKGWNAGIVSDYYEVKGGKRIPKGMGYANGVTAHPYLRATDMKNETILDDDIHYIDEEVYEHIKRYTVKGGDIYLTNVGVNLGMAGVIPEKYDGANLTENAVKLVPKTEKVIDGIFLAHYINSPGIQDYINERKMSVGVPKLAIFRIETMPLLLPPMDIQMQFIEFCNQVDKSKVAVQKSLDETQQLFDSLMQKYFG